MIERDPDIVSLQKSRQSLAQLADSNARERGCRKLRRPLRQDPIDEDDVRDRAGDRPKVSQLAETGTTPSIG